MPTFLFACDTCSQEFEKRFSVADVREKKHQIEIPCPDCANPLRRDFNAEFQTLTFLEKKSKLKPLLIGDHAEDWKRKRAAETDIAIYNEGFESESEMKESLDMAKELEKAKGLTPGTLTTGVKAPVTQEEKAAVKSKVEAKRDASVAKRRKVL